jgi:hypothetical protein
VPSSVSAQQPADETSSARFLAAFGATATCVLVLIAAANYIVNPLDLYPPRIFEPAVRSSRVTKMRLLTRQDRGRLEAIVLGSSRSMQLAPSTIAALTGRRAFNFATDSAMAEDYYANLRWLVEDAGVTPSLLIVGADVEAFHERAEPDERLLAIAALSKYLQHGERGTAGAGRLRRLISAQQTRTTVNVLARAGLGRPAPVVWHFEDDGYLRYDDLERERAAGAFALDKHIQTSVTEYRARFAGFSALSERRKAYFTATLAYARSKNIAVIVFLTPLHPVVIRALEAQGYEALASAAAAFLADAARASGATFVDLSTIDRFGGDPQAFWDGGHMDPHNMDRLTQRLLGLQRAVQ